MIDMLAHPDKHVKGAVIASGEGVVSTGEFFEKMTELGWRCSKKCYYAACSPVETAVKTQEAFQKPVSNVEDYSYLTEEEIALKIKLIDKEKKLKKCFAKNYHKSIKDEKNKKIGREKHQSIEVGGLNIKWKVLEYEEKWADV